MKFLKMLVIVFKPMGIDSTSSISISFGTTVTEANTKREPSNFFTQCLQSKKGLRQDKKICTCQTLPEEEEEIKLSIESTKNCHGGT